MQVQFQPLLAVGPMMTLLNDAVVLSGGESSATGIGPLSALMYMALLLLWVWFAPNTQQLVKAFEPAFESFQGQIKAVYPGVLAFRLNAVWACLLALLMAYSIFGTSQTSQFLYFNF
jgi:hypothetical protein